MLPIVPTLVFRKDNNLEQKLLSLVLDVKSNKSKDDTLILNRFIEEYLHIDKTKVPKTKKHKNQYLLCGPISKEEKEQIKEIAFLNNCIQQGYNWNFIAKKLRLNTKPSRRQWNYDLYLVFAIMKRLPGTLGYFFAIKLFDKAWASVAKMFIDLRHYPYIEKQVEQLIQKSQEQLKQIDNIFLRNMLLSIKMQEGIQATLARMNFPNLLKNEKKYTTNFQQWHQFLSYQFTSNRALQRPQVKCDKQRFIVKWIKCKHFPIEMTFEFNKRLQKIINSGVSDGGMISEVEQILVSGIASKVDWNNIKQQIKDLVQKINRFQDSNQLKRQLRSSQKKGSKISANKTNLTGYDSDDQQSVHSSVYAATAKSVKSQRPPGRPKLTQIQVSHQSQHIKNEFKIYEEQSIFIPSPVFGKNYVDDAQQMTFRQYAQTEIQVDRDRSLIEKSVELDEDQQQMLFYLHHLEEEIDIVKENYFKTTDRKRLKFCYENKKQNLEEKMSIKYDLFLKHKQIINDLKNNDMRRVLASLVVFKRSALEVQKMLMKRKNYSQHNPDTEQSKDTENGSSFAYDDSMESQKLKKLSHRFPNFSKKNHQSRKPHIDRFKSYKTQVQ